MAEKKEEKKDEKQPSKLIGTTRSALSWLKPCGNEKTLATIRDLDADELMEVIRIAKAVIKEAQSVMNLKAGKSLPELEKQYEELGKKISYYKEIADKDKEK